LRYCWGQLHLAALQLCQQQHWQQAALPACQHHDCECRLLLLLFLVGAVLLVLLPVRLVLVVVHLTCLVQPPPLPPQ
jgi:hypothetical protein